MVLSNKRVFCRKHAESGKRAFSFDYRYYPGRALVQPDDGPQERQDTDMYRQILLFVLILP